MATRPKPKHTDEQQPILHQKYIEAYPSISYLLAPWVLIATDKVASTKPTDFENQSSFHTTETLK